MMTYYTLVSLSLFCIQSISVFLCYWENEEYVSYLTRLKPHADYPAAPESSITILLSHVLPGKGL